METVNSYYIGEMIAIKGHIETRKIYFLGANKKEGFKWDVNFTFSANEGYAGNGNPFVLNLNIGDKLRIGEKFKASTVGKEKGKLKEIKFIIIEDILKDCIKIRIVFND